MDGFGEIGANGPARNRGRRQRSMNQRAPSAKSSSSSTLPRTTIAPSTSYDLSVSKSLARLRAFDSRRSTRAARELLDNLVDYRELPQRLERFCQHLLNDGDDDDDNFDGLKDISKKLCLQNRLRDMTAAVLATAPSSFFECVTRTFQAWIAQGIEGEEEEDDVYSHQAIDWVSFSNSMVHLNWMVPPCRAFRGGGSSGGGGGLVRPCWQVALERTVMKRVRTVISGDFSCAFFPELLEWAESVEDWIEAHAKTLLLPPAADVGDEQENDPALYGGLEDQFGTEDERIDRSSLQRILDECYCLVRMEEVFDMVAEYPDSHGAVVELRDVLSRTGWHGQLAQQLQAQLVKRLNHPGANTSQIIDVYISVIKVLSVLDPTTTSSMALASSLRSSSSAAPKSSASRPLLSVVADPVRRYLCSRADTVRCIISSLTDATAGGDLYRELKRQDAKPLENVVVDSDDEEECPDMSWQPPPPIWSSRNFGTVSSLAPTGTAGAASPAAVDSDILAMLVSIYGSKELFVDEYRIMLADKLLALSRDYNTDQAVHTLELLKLRFSESSMRNCEVMIKDMDDSKRTNANIHSTLKSTAAVDVAMISHIFWPPLQNEPLKHHPRLQAQLDAFSGEYARLKNPRKLIWLDQLGTVDLELDCLDAKGETLTTRSFTCTPLLATVISHFEDKATWSLEDLSNETSVPTHVLQKKMLFWVNQRVLLQSWRPDGSLAYELASAESHVHDTSNGRGAHPYTNAASGGLGGPLHVLDDDDDGAAAVSVSAQEKAEMEVYESYIVGMLTNAHGGLQLLRIHTMLQTFVSGSDTKYNKTPAQLSAFLQTLCQQEKLECGPDGMYKLFKRHR